MISIRLQGKVAVVTGARQGIGEAVAIALAREGADLVLASRSIQEEHSVVQETRKLGCRVLVKQVDVGDRLQVAEMVEKTMSELGRVDVLFNNAGLSKPAMLWKMPGEQWDEVIRVNLTGTFNCMHAVAGIMKEQESGAIINVTSSAGLAGTIGQVNYTAAKGGVHALTKSAAKELARFNVRVNCVSPMAETEMTQKISQDPKFKQKYLESIPLGRFAQPEEIAPLVVFLASDESSYLTGQTVCADGGLVML